MSTLYELTETYQELLSMALDPETDLEALADTMEAVDGEIEVKADGYAKVMKELKAIADARKAEAKRLLDGAKSVEANIDRMKSALESAMRLTGKTKFKTALFSFGIQKNIPSVSILDESKIPEQFLIPQSPKIDKRAIMAALKDGEHYEWAEVVQTESLRIR